MITIGWQEGKALVLAPLPLAVAHVEVHLHWAGYSLIAIWWDLHHQGTLQSKMKGIQGLAYKTRSTGYILDCFFTLPTPLNLTSKLHWPTGSKTFALSIVHKYELLVKPQIY